MSGNQNISVDTKFIAFHDTCVHGLGTRFPVNILHQKHILKRIYIDRNNSTWSSCQFFSLFTLLIPKEAARGGRSGFCNSDDWSRSVEEQDWEIIVSNFSVLRLRVDSFYLRLCRFYQTFDNRLRFSAREYGGNSITLPQNWEFQLISGIVWGSKIRALFEMKKLEQI